MAGPSISDSNNAEEIAAALFNKLALQSSDLRRYAVSSVCQNIQLQLTAILQNTL